MCTEEWKGVVVVKGMKLLLEMAIDSLCRRVWIKSTGDESKIDFFLEILGRTRSDQFLVPDEFLYTNMIVSLLRSRICVCRVLIDVVEFIMAVIVLLTLWWSFWGLWYCFCA